MELELAPLNLPSDNERPFVIAGPCSAETEEQVMTTAKQLAMKGCHNFRAGVWKPRTKPGGFEGHGEPALQWLKQVKEETKMLVSTEVATPEHVELALKYGIDILWIGARTSANPFAMQALADSLQGVDIPVFVKNPVNPDLELWIGALERINQAGVKRLGAIHRGFSSYEKKIYRNMPMWQIPIELHRRIPDLPIISDPSHIGGRRELVAPLCQQAMDLGFDGLIIESHCDPDKAWSDASLTNLWPNRLIGDDALPCDATYGKTEKGDGGIQSIPRRVFEGKPSPTGRHTFTTWRLWKKDEKLLPSGLIGPVRLIR